MRLLSRIWFPAAVVTAITAGTMGLSPEKVEYYDIPAEYCSISCDTVVYPEDGYKLRRVADFSAYKIADSLIGKDIITESRKDTTPAISARDTIKAPDSLRFTDPFRYKYYVALCDSLTHRQVRDSLLKRVDSLKKSALKFRLDSNFTLFRQDSTFAGLDSADRFRLDSLYASDSCAAVRAKFLAWYNSLSRQERKKYDMEQFSKIKIKQLDSIRKIKEKEKAIKDSITEYTPRVLDTYIFPDSMQYKRIVNWKLDPDFHDIELSVPDTSFNKWFHDYAFRRNDVNATWLGMAGSPVQYYNWFKQDSDEGVEFYKTLEPWSYSPRTIPFYNSKTPYTELAYWGTLAGKKSKQSNNIHILTTQNITPALNITLLAEKFGGEGILENESSKNSNIAAYSNYLGKKYLMHAGVIHNKINRGENGGIAETDRSGHEGNMWIRDTTVDSREVPVALTNASSKTTKTTFFLDQQFRIPFDFIQKARMRRDSTYVPDTLHSEVTTAFIGHSTEYSIYSRKYTDKITASDVLGRGKYQDAFGNYLWNYNALQSADSMHVSKFDNKLFIRLQPWSSEGIISKLDVGIGDRLRTYFDSTSTAPTKHIENDVYLYAGARGQFRQYFNWNAKADYVFAGYNFSDFGIEGNLQFNCYPFRRARTSPISVNAHFENTLRAPDFYQKHVRTNHYRWDSDFLKTNTMKIQGGLNIPHWKLKADVGYSLISNKVYYDSLSIARQKTDPISVLSASLRKDFVFGPVHLENNALLQFSSCQEAIPLPTLALNLRWYVQFVVQKDESKTHNVLVMQIGADAYANTPWYSPGWNPNLGVFYNQRKNTYTNGPWFDLFINMQWKRACIFIKYQNMGRGWPLERADYFSADHYIVTQPGIDGLKFGIWWPFYIQPHKHTSVGGGSGGGGGGGIGGLGALKSALGNN